MGQLVGIVALAVSCAQTAAQTPAESPPSEAPPADTTSAQGATSPASNIVGQVVTYQSGETPLVGYLAYDASSTERRPGILVVHEWWGPTEYVRTRARQLAELGYVALAVDMYGNGKTVTEPSEAQALSSDVFANLDQAEDRFKAAIQVLSSNAVTQPDNISAVGYCFGGGIILNMARRGVELDGVASFHGSLGAAQPAQPGAVKAKVLVLTGDADPMVPPEQVEAFRKEMADAAVPTEIHSYPGALHAFTNPAATETGKKYQLPIAYDAKADAESWQALKHFLAELYPRTKPATSP
jgi:dienelactone hydrolase